jgi:hypothetical protein
MSKRKQICDLLSAWILEVKSSVMHESYRPSPDADGSDDAIRDGEELIKKLRSLREQIEEA